MLIRVPGDFYKTPNAEKEYKRLKRLLEFYGEKTDTMPKTLRGLSNKQIAAWLWFAKFEVSFHGIKIKRVV